MSLIYVVISTVWFVKLTLITNIFLYVSWELTVNMIK